MSVDERCVCNREGSRGAEARGAFNVPIARADDTEKRRSAKPQGELIRSRRCGRDSGYVVHRYR